MTLFPGMEVDLVPLADFSVVTMCAPGFREPMDNFTAGRLSREQKRARP